MSYDEARALDNKSQTAFAVTIICACFVGETLQVTRMSPKPATIVVLSILAVVGLIGLGVGIHYYRLARRTPTT